MRYRRILSNETVILNYRMRSNLCAAGYLRILTDKNRRNNFGRKVNMGRMRYPNFFIDQLLSRGRKQNRKLIFANKFLVSFIQVKKTDRRKERRNEDSFTGFWLLLFLVKYLPRQKMIMPVKAMQATNSIHSTH